MNLQLNRTSLGPHATIGDLFIDSAWECFSLEPGSADGKGPIPVGGYDVVINFSQRFQRRMPQLLSVPGFDGIRIHSGNTDKDTAGCILVGQGSDGKTVVMQSRPAFDALFAKIDAALDAGEAVRLTISEPQIPPVSTIGELGGE